MTGKAAHRLCVAAFALVLTGSALASERIHYTYDARGRLVGVSRTQEAVPGFATSYVYDAADNRTRKEVAEIVPNPSFELPEIGSGYVYSPTVARIAFTHPAGVTGNNSAFGFAAAPSGDQVAFVQSVPGATGAIALSVIGLEPGETYRVRFRLVRRPGYGLNPVTVAAGGTGLGTFTPSSTAWESFSVPFTAAASSITISFTGSASQGDSASGLDLVTIGPP
jgi:YD repeat-containing protein